MIIKFISKKEAEKIVPDDNMAIISISGMGDDRKLNVNWEHRLDLDFDDVDAPGSFTIVTKQGNVELPYITFNENMARKVLQFAYALPDTIDIIIVHCHAGISRSAAVAKFLAEEIYDVMFPPQYMLYNKLVYRTLIKIFQKTKEEQFKQELGK